MKKSRIWIMVVVGLLFVAGVIFYGQLNWYARGKIISFVFQEDWPLARGASHHFKQHRADFNAVASVFAKYPTIRYISFPYDIDSGYCTQISRYSECKFQDDHEIRESIIATNLYPIFRTESDYVLFYAGPEIRGDRRYDIAILQNPNTSNREREHCSAVDKKTEFGACYISIEESWTIEYEWMPRFGSGTIIEDTQEFAEDVAEELHRKNSK